MERQAGLGRSLNEVIESLTPAETDAPLARGTDLHDITPQLYRLVLDVRNLRDRVDRLEADGSGNGHPTTSKKSKKKRNATGGKKTKKS